MSKKTTSEKSTTAAEAADQMAPNPIQPDAPAAAEAPAAEAGPDYRALYDQANDRWLRARAEFDNYRKRIQREFAEIRTQTVLQTVNEFLGVHDQLGLALVHARASAEAQAIREGLELIHAEFGRVLGNLGVTRIETAGQVFDPGLHEAIAQEPSGEVPAGTIVREVKAGYVLGERLLRPATVTVSSGPAAPAASNVSGAEPATAKQ